MTTDTQPVVTDNEYIVAVTRHRDDDRIRDSHSHNDVQSFCSSQQIIDGLGISHKALHSSIESVTPPSKAVVGVAQSASFSN